MKLKTEDGGWNPYLAGALLGLLAIVSVYATTQLLGKTSYLERQRPLSGRQGYLKAPWFLLMSRKMSILLRKKSRSIGSSC